MFKERPDIDEVGLVSKINEKPAINYLLSRDAVALREHARMVTPDIDLSWDYMDEDGVNHTLQLPITTKFFWPESAI